MLSRSSPLKSGVQAALFTDSQNKKFIRVQPNPAKSELCSGLMNRAKSELCSGLINNEQPWQKPAQDLIRLKDFKALLREKKM